MKSRSIQTIVQALNEARVRYLVVGGLAVVAHGHVRFTADVDLILAIDHENLSRAVAAVKALDYRPRAPVNLDEFIDPASRSASARDKGMAVFSLFSPRHPATEIDLFLEPPLDFEGAFARAVRLEVAPGVVATFATLDDLIELKTRAGRTPKGAQAMNTRPDPPESEHVWERGWEDHEFQQLQRLSKLTLIEKLAWLEEAHRMVRHMEANRGRASNAVSEPG